jgi:tetratricopeptide (TPR) repeat protein
LEHTGATGIEAAGSGLQLPPVSARPVLALVAEEVFALEFEPVEALVNSAEQALARHDYAQAISLLAAEHLSTTSYPELALRALLAQSWARMCLGELGAAGSLLERARALTEREAFSDVDRAEVLYRLGCCRLNLSQVSNATALLTLALELCDRSSLPCDRLRARILDWRSRCYQRQRDWPAARADVERGLELADGISDEHVCAGLYLQASLIAERQGDWLLARCYGEQALDLHESCGDRLGVHKLLNNLGGINFLLGNHEQAVTYLQDAFRVALELGNDIGAAYAMCSLAQVQLKTGQPAAGEGHARRALELLGNRLDHLAEIGNAQLVLGRCLLEQSRHDEAEAVFRAAGTSFEQLSSISHRAAAWIAQGDLAARRGETEAAAALYRRAAEALQDFHF